MDYDQLAKLAHVMTPENFPRLEHPDLGMTPGVGMPTQLQDMPSEPRRPAPLTGEHTREILEEGGYSAAAIDELIEQGAVGERSRILAKDLEE
jgi:crotonobetainyl-CoA:carnitine CoA-transferase CaiB-like acyl-CoA transferase